jgi:hypothetical protein
MNLKVLSILLFFSILQESFAQKDSVQVIKEAYQTVRTFECPGAINNQFTLKGIIYDAQTKEELPSATVFVKGTKVATLSDAKGLFALDITKLLDSTRTLTIMGSYVGYKIKEIEIKDNWTLGTYLSIPMVSNQGISCPGIDVSPKKRKSKKK